MAKYEIRVRLKIHCRNLNSSLKESQLQSQWSAVADAQQRNWILFRHWNAYGWKAWTIFGTVYHMESERRLNEKWKWFLFCLNSLFDVNKAASGLILEITRQLYTFWVNGAYYPPYMVAETHYWLEKVNPLRVIKEFNLITALKNLDVIYFWDYEQQGIKKPWLKLLL